MSNPRGVRRQMAISSARCSPILPQYQWRRNGGQNTNLAPGRTCQARATAVSPTYNAQMTCLARIRRQALSAIERLLIALGLCVIVSAVVVAALILIR